MGPSARRGRIEGPLPSSIPALSSVPVSLDLSDREVVRLHCDACGHHYERVVIFATQDGDAYSVVSAACHGHGHREVWLDATFGSWQEPYADHVTMSCRVSPSGAGAVDAPVASAGQANHVGQLLSREETLASSRLPEFWALVDAVVTTVPEARSLIYGD